VNQEVCITGAGVLSPAGIGKDALVKCLDEARTCIGPITRYHAGDTPVRLAGEVPGFEPTDFMSNRVAKKCDRFSHLALVAADQALQDAALDLDTVDRRRVGIVVGNNLGGWEFGERGLYELYRQGAGRVNPYQASAWFPAAPQGQISIRHDIRGYSKTIIADRASGLAALATAVRVLRLGRVDTLLAGGTEAPVARYAMLCYCAAGELSPATDPCGAFLPFDLRRSGLVVGEGAVFLVLETAAAAARRGAGVYGRLAGYGVTNDPPGAEAKPAAGLARAMRLALRQAGWSADEVDLVVCEGAAREDADAAEAAAVADILGDRARSTPVTVPKTALGHLFGAAGPLDVCAALFALARRCVPATANLHSPDPRCPLDLVARTPRRGVRVERVLICAHGRGGVNVCLAVAGPTGGARRF